MPIPTVLTLVFGLAVVAVMAVVPLFAGDYMLSTLINILSYGAMATAWAMFSGTTRYISLATSAFFGIGAYVLAVNAETVPYPVLLIAAGLVGGLVAIVVAVATLRLRGMYFVIFTFGLAELIREVVNWWEINFSGSVGRYVFLDITGTDIYYQLLVLLVAVILIGIWLNRSRYGYALRVMGDDEEVARHIGINTTAVKSLVFAFTAVVIAMVGCIMAPRWSYTDPTIAFNPMISFQVVIMALLGGVHRLYGPLLGVIPLTLLSDYLSATFPNYFVLVLGLCFLAIVYALPQGIAGVLEKLYGAVRRKQGSR